MCAYKILPSFTEMSKTINYKKVVSLDIHDNSTYVFSANRLTGEIYQDFRVHGHYHKVKKHLLKLGKKKDIIVLLEAGPLGFAPVRHFQKHGYTTKMIAPSSIPRSPQSRKKKTDRDDAIDNFHYYCSGNLRYVFITGVEDEQARECLRERQSIVYQITKGKQKLLSLLKRHGIVYNLTKGNWTKTHYKWLERVELPIHIRSIVNLYLTRLQRLSDEEQVLFQLFDDYLSNHPKYAQLRKFYEMLAGIGSITSATLILEGGDLGRFPHPRPLMSYTGLVPGKRQSGAKDPVIRITKYGNKYFRTALVSIAKYYRDFRFLHSEKKLKDLPEFLRKFIQRCQDRLCRRYQALRKAGKLSTKARVAVARELCGFLWEYSTVIIPQLIDENVTIAA